MSSERWRMVNQDFTTSMFVECEAGHTVMAVKGSEADKQLRRRDYDGIAPDAIKLSSKECPFCKGRIGVELLQEFMIH